MSISDGVSANAVNFNASFMSRTVNTSTTGQVDLNNADAASGSTIANIQRAMNFLGSYSGSGLAGAHDDVPVWTSSIVGTASDSLKARLEAITLLFENDAGSGSHTHDGTDGQGAKIDAANLANTNLYFAARQAADLTAASGTSTDVSAQMAGKTAGGGASAVGVVTNAPRNRCHILSTSTETFVEDANGQRVYGRVTEAAGVWTLSYYTNEAGVETAHTLSSQDITFVYLEVFDQNTRPTFHEDFVDHTSMDLTADIVDASASQRGLVNTSAQTIAGDKTFTGSTDLDGGATIASLTGVLKGSTGVVSAGDVDLASEVTGTLPITNGGSGATTAQGLQDASSPMTTKGDVEAHNGTNVVRVAVGTNGQALVADSAEAAGVKWADVTGFTSPLTTKGDLLTYTTTDARLPVGADGTTLVADSAAAAGVTWSTPSIQIAKVSKTHADWQIAATTFTVNLFTSTDNIFIHKIIAKTTTLFAGTGITDYKMDIGDGSDLDLYYVDYDVDLAAEASNFITVSADEIQSFGATTISASAKSTGADLNQSTAGAIDFYIIYSKLP